MDSSNEKDIQDNKIMGVLAYLGILVLVPIFGAKESKFARFHANQGLILLICSVAWSIVYVILTIVLASIGLGFISAILYLISLAFLVLAIIGIVNAAQGKMKELPIIGNLFTILK